MQDVLSSTSDEFILDILYLLTVSHDNMEINVEDCQQQSNYEIRGFSLLKGE